MDLTDMRSELDRGVRFVHADIPQAQLRAEHFDAALVSNFLEHLPEPEAVFQFLGKMRSVLRPGGRIAVMGPNFRYCAREYFDCAEHILALTHVAVEEHLYGAGFEVVPPIIGSCPIYSASACRPARGWYATTCGCPGLGGSSASSFWLLAGARQATRLGDEVAEEARVRRGAAR